MRALFRDGQADLDLGMPIVELPDDRVDDVDAFVDDDSNRRLRIAR